MPQRRGFLAIAGLCALTIYALVEFILHRDGKAGVADTIFLPISIFRLLTIGGKLRFHPRSMSQVCHFGELERLLPRCSSRNGIVFWMCTAGTSCAGLGDQIRGLSSVFLNSALLGYSFGLTWNNPDEIIPILLQLSPHAKATYECSKWEFRKAQLFGAASQLNLPIISANDACTWREHKALAIRSNANFVANFQSNLSCDTTGGRLEAWARRVKPHVLGCVFWTLFRLGSSLSKAVENELLRLRHFGNGLSGHVIAVHLRMGDSAMQVAPKTVDMRFARLGLLQSEPWPERFVSCALALERRMGLANSTIYFLSDSQQAKKEAKAFLPDRVLLSSATPFHTATFRGTATAKRNGLIQVWTDLLVAALSDGMVESISGFSNTAVQIGHMTPSQLMTAKECLAVLNITTRSPNRTVVMNASKVVLKGWFLASDFGLELEWLSCSFDNVKEGVLCWEVEGVGVGEGGLGSVGCGDLR